jgi:hypothetical protein
MSHLACGFFKSLMGYSIDILDSVTQSRKLSRWFPRTLVPVDAAGEWRFNMYSFNGDTKW